MIVRVNKSPEKDLKKIKNKSPKAKLYKTAKGIQEASNLAEFKGLKKLRGTKALYRIRIGDYRLGISIEKNEVHLIRFLHRKEVYRYFP